MEHYDVREMSEMVTVKMMADHTLGMVLSRIKV